MLLLQKNFLNEVQPYFFLVSNMLKKCVYEI